MRPWSRLALGALSLGSISQCVDPTEIVLEIGTDVACADVHEVGISVGAPGSDALGFSTVTSNCSSDGGIGSLVVTPSGAGTAVGIRVVMGVDASAEACQPPSYDGCIVARRSLSYVPHTPLHLPIDLRASCLGVACSPDSTCSNGACVEAGVPCVGNQCDLPDAGTPPPPVDAGTCTDVLDVLITTGVNSIASPRIARLAAGYAIMWQQASQVMVMIIDEAGHPQNTFSLGLTYANESLDSIGSDGTNVLGVYQTILDGGTAMMAIESTPNGVTTAYTMAGSVGPIGGVLWNASAQRYFFGGGVNGGAMLFDAPPITISTLAVPVNATDFSLSGDGTAYTLSFVVSAGCSVYSCTPTTATSYACAAQPLSLSSCTGIRTAMSGGITHVGVFAAGSVSLQEVGGTNPPSVIAQADNGRAFNLIATGSSPVHVVSRLGSSLTSDTVPQKQASPTVIAKTAYTGAGAGFDSVADGPDKTSFGVVYVGSTNTNPAAVKFAHICK